MKSPHNSELLHWFWRELLRTSTGDTSKHPCDQCGLTATRHMVFRGPGGDYDIDISDNTMRAKWCGTCGRWKWILRSR